MQVEAAQHAVSLELLTLDAGDAATEDVAALLLGKWMPQMRWLFSTIRESGFDSAHAAPGLQLNRQIAEACVAWHVEVSLCAASERLYAAVSSCAA